MTYAPSATVHHLCCAKRAAGETSLVMGVPDAATPFIREEVAAVAAALPRPRVLLGEEASEEMLRRRTDGHFETLGRAEGIERLGGLDVDQAIFGHVVRSVPSLAGLVEVGPDHDGLADDPAMVAATANLRRACVEAKEGLSVETSVTTEGSDR